VSVNGCFAVGAAAAMEMGRSFQNPPTLEALLPTLVTMDQAQRLFDLMPGLEYCSYDQPSGYLLLHASAVTTNNNNSNNTQICKAPYAKLQRR